MSSRVIAVDVGGTCIDVVSLDRSSGEVTVAKQPSTLDRLAEEVATALGQLPGSSSDVDRLLHGSTVAVNTLLQRSGATVGLLTDSVTAYGPLEVGDVVSAWSGGDGGYGHDPRQG